MRNDLRSILTVVSTPSLMFKNKKKEQEKQKTPGKVNISHEHLFFLSLMHL